MALKLNINTKPSNNYESEDLKQFERQVVPIESLLIWASTNQCSDVYIKEYSQPYISRFGQIIRIPCVPTTRDEWMNFYDNYIKEELNAKYVRQKMLDTSTEIRIPEDNPYYGKFDKNFFRYRTSLGFSENNRIATFRMIRPEDPTFDTINYPEECKEALKQAYNQKTGIVFYTGPTGSGKGLHKNTVIPSIDGNKTVETLKIGDIIFDKNGEQTSVVDKYCPNDPELFRFHLSDGTCIDSTGGHLWEVETLNDWKPIKYAVRYMDSDFLSFLDTINLGVIKLNDYINIIVENSKFSKSSFTNFIYKYFKDTIEKNNDYYIDSTLVSKMIKDWYHDVTSKPAPKIKLMSSKQLYTLGAYNSNNRINFAIRRPKRTQYNNIDLPIDPYIFYIKNIEKIDGNKKDYYCLAVDSPTHMFLCTDSYVPTHNTTTLAAVMNTFTRPGEILDNKVFITLEDPIEYTYHSTDSVKFSQKELDKDFMSYASGIKQSLREHPNCINIGEARDREVISAAIEAARTGHLVTTSFHAGDVGGTISRLLFHLDNNKDLSYDLILNLNIIMSQKLLKMEDHYQVDTQYLLFTDEVREYLLKVIDNDENIQVSINKLIKDKRFQDMKLVKDWDYA